MRTIAEADRALGRRQGLRKGREEGREEGRTVALRQAVLAVMEARFKKLPRTASARVERAESSTLRRWLVAAATARSASAVFS